MLIRGYFLRNHSYASFADGARVTEDHLTAHE